MPNEFKSLDAATLSAEEYQALDRLHTGRGGDYDRAILRRALRQQRATSTGGNDAA